MIIPSRNGIERIEDQTLEFTFRESYMTYYDRISKRTHTNIQLIRQKRNIFSGFDTYQKSWELSLILIVTIQFTAIQF
jgi:hypothetical protein